MIINTSFYKNKVIFSLFILLYIVLGKLELYSINLPDGEDIYNYDLESLSKLEISSVSKSPISYFESPVTVNVVTAKQINERGYQTLEDIMRDLPGFQFRNIQSFNTYSFQRGIPNQNNLILLLIDGIQVNELNSGGYYGGGLYNLSNIEKIEVIYGPGSVAYGTNAVTGVINLITKPMLKNSIEAKLTAGSFNTILADASMNLVIKDEFSARLTAMVNKTNKTNLKGDAGDNNWTDLLDNFEDNVSIGLKMKYLDFSFGINYLNKTSSAGTYEKSVGTHFQDFGTIWDISFYNMYLKYDKTFAQDFAFNSTLYSRIANVNDNSILFVLDTTQIGYYRPNMLIGLENILNWKYSENISLTSGITFEYEELSNGYSMTYSGNLYEKPPAPNKPKMLSNRLVGIFAEPQIKLFNSLFFLFGARYDISSVYNQVFTPRVGLSYSIENQIIRLSYSEAFRAPKPWDYTDGLGNPELISEKMKSFEIGLTLNLIENLKIDIMAYKNSLKNAISRQNIGESYKWVNQGEIKTDGVEFAFNYNFNNVNLFGNYTFNQSVNDKGELVPEISKHTANLGIAYYYVNLRLNYIGKRNNPTIIPALNSNVIDDALIINGTARIFKIEDNGYSEIKLYLTVNNILNTKYYHTSNRTVSRYAQAERSFFLTLSYSFKHK